MSGKHLITWNDRLNWALEHRGVTKASLARACKVSRAAIQEWTNGLTENPKLAPFFAACEKLKVRPRWLALGETPIDPLTDDLPTPTRGPELTELLTEIALALARRSDDDQRRILEIVMRMPEGERPTKRRAAAR